MFDTSRPFAIMLIGLPGCGKSTYVKKAQAVLDGLGVTYTIVSSDDYIQAIADASGKTYNEVFRDNVKDAERNVNATLQQAIKTDSSVIWDQTNLSAKIRSGRIKQFPKHYYKLAVVVRCNVDAEWNKRLTSRPGKIIPPNVLESMSKNFELPTLEEGFDEIQEIIT